MEDSIIYTKKSGKVTASIDPILISTDIENINQLIIANNEIIESKKRENEELKRKQDRLLALNEGVQNMV